MRKAKSYFLVVLLIVLYRGILTFLSGKILTFSLKMELFSSTFLSSVCRFTTSFTRKFWILSNIVLGLLSVLNSVMELVVKMKLIKAKYRISYKVIDIVKIQAQTERPVFFMCFSILIYTYTCPLPSLS